jgi:hypothetical protein
MSTNTVAGCLPRYEQHVQQYEKETAVDARFLRNDLSPTAPSAEHVVQLLDVLAAGDLRATVDGLEGVLAFLRPALAASNELQTRVPPETLVAALELRRARVGSA